ncbi:PSME3-interacting protein isoform X1 [Lates japonicus]|uniref:PSME3-interacting protein isoform X1 n=1 Tax=Lates japonicus TaxID=270547 RepID=A0AAD3MUF7_LATJO|nr:PSME3-interacting protein isoform X1 [Lates japonicus]
MGCRGNCIIACALVKQASTESRKEPEKKTAPKHSGSEQRTSHLSQAHLLAGAVKRRSSSQSSDSSKKQKVEITTTTTGNGDRHTEQEEGAGGGAGGAEDQQTVPGLTAKSPSVSPELQSRRVTPAVGSRVRRRFTRTFKPSHQSRNAYPDDILPPPSHPTPNPSHSDCKLCYWLREQ